MRAYNKGIVCNIWVQEQQKNSMHNEAQREYKSWGAEEIAQRQRWRGDQVAPLKVLQHSQLAGNNFALSSSPASMFAEDLPCI